MIHAPAVQIRPTARKTAANVPWHSPSCNLFIVASIVALRGFVESQLAIWHSDCCTEFGPLLRTRWFRNRLYCTRENGSPSLWLFCRTKMEDITRRRVTSFLSQGTKGGGTNCDDVLSIKFRPYFSHQCFIFTRTLSLSLSHFSFFRKKDSVIWFVQVSVCAEVRTSYWLIFNDSCRIVIAGRRHKFSRNEKIKHATRRFTISLVFSKLSHDNFYRKTI